MSGLSQAARNVAVAAVIVAWVAVSATMIYGAFVVRIYNPDYSVFWTAAQVSLGSPERLYDIEFITAAQHWLIVGNPRPWAYPPSAVLVLLPFGLLPFSASFVAWNMAGLTAFVIASRRLVSRWSVALGLIAPPVVRALYAGQFSLLLTALAIGGIVTAKSRPVLGGMLLGVGMAIKPQLFFLAPLMLDRKGVAGFAAGSLAMFAVSLPLGPERWLEWFEALPRFTAVVQGMGILDRGVSPLSAAALLGVDGVGAKAMQLIGVAGGLALAVWARNGDAGTRIFGMIAGALLCSPYALFYDLAPLAPLAAAALLSGRLRGVIVALPMTFIAAPLTFPAAVAAVAIGGDNQRRDTPPRP